MKTGNERIHQLQKELRSLKERIGELEHKHTQRMHMEQALQVHKSSYRDLIETHTDLVCRYLPDTTLTLVNEAYCRHFQKTREELIGNSFMPYILENEREQVLKNFQNLTPENPVVMYDGPIRLPGKKEVIWQHWSNQGIFDEENNLIEIQSIGQDITRRKNMELALQQSEVDLIRQKKELEHKNIALRELMEQVGIEKNELKDDVRGKVRDSLASVIDRLKQEDPGSLTILIEIIERTLRDIAGSFGHTLTGPVLKMTPKEIEICNLIRSGFSTKEIASYLDVSVHTIASHRGNIRKKLGIENEKVNLSVYLQTL